MGASNFYNENASRVFSIDFEKSWEYEDQISLIEDILSEKGYYEGGSDANELHSYPSRVLGQKSVFKEYAGLEFGVKIVAVARSGYYAGANFDWSIEVLVDGCEYDFDDISPETFKDAFIDAGTHEGIAAFTSHFAHAWCRRQSEILVYEIEKVYEKNTEALVIVARFSNGETIYQKAS